MSKEKDCIKLAATEMRRYRMEDYTQEGLESALAHVVKLSREARRQHFEAAGKLYPCPNPRHKFSIGRLIGEWRWAKESWCHMNDTGNLVTTWLGVSKTETPDGLRLVSVTLWKLCVMFGLKVGAGEPVNKEI